MGLQISVKKDSILNSLGCVGEHSNIFALFSPQTQRHYNILSHFYFAPIYYGIYKGASLFMSKPKIMFIL